MNITELSIEGCYEITPDYFSDERGVFTKTFHEDIFRESNIEFTIREEFYSLSHKNVLRGLHFQIPPRAHKKLVYCVSGKAIDFFVDLRSSSSTFGRHIQLELCSSTPRILFLPPGIAHGFLSCENNTILVYKTDCVYSPEHDKGILWSSCNIDLPIENFVISSRDKSFPAFDQFQSPFL